MSPSLLSISDTRMGELNPASFRDPRNPSRSALARKCAVLPFRIDSSVTNRPALNSGLEIVPGVVPALWDVTFSRAPANSLKSHVQYRISFARVRLRLQLSGCTDMRRSISIRDG